MSQAGEAVNPRHLREKFKEWEGKRVTVGLTTFHYICGTWKALHENTVKFQIGAHEMEVPIAQIATISDAPPLQADFFK